MYIDPNNKSQELVDESMILNYQSPVHRIKLSTVNKYLHIFSFLQYLDILNRNLQYHDIKSQF
jgi:hypothetical protein